METSPRVILFSDLSGQVPVACIIVRFKCEGLVQPRLGRQPVRQGVLWFHQPPARHFRPRWWRVCENSAWGAATASASIGYLSRRPRDHAVVRHEKADGCLAHGENNSLVEMKFFVRDTLPPTVQPVSYHRLKKGCGARSSFFVRP